MKLGEFLLQSKGRIVQGTLNIQVEEWDPTYGGQIKTRQIEIIDFDELCRQIDLFSETFKCS